MELQIRIFRTYREQSTIGKAWVELAGSYPIFDFVTLELPWKDNQQNISCIPEGKYTWQKYMSPKHGEVLLIHQVPNRSMIEIHKGNFTTDIEGCILPGDSHTDINGDGVIDVTNSAVTLNKILDICGQSGTIIIESL